jgi:hypothetical protein
MRGVILCTSVRIYIIRNKDMTLRRIQFSLNKKGEYFREEIKN